MGHVGPLEAGKRLAQGVVSDVSPAAVLHGRWVAHFLLPGAYGDCLWEESAAQFPHLGPQSLGGGIDVGAGS